ncbi:hypothetical protein ACFQ4C_30350 [Larkinella insperata]|uniref:Outer membrane protein beta-barrel domain-containing protein n=1 Tax=Larkinella insperata TaxID=332158 RepID=A0ABW3QGZ7_9BACT
MKTTLSLAGLLSLIFSGSLFAQQSFERKNVFLSAGPVFFGQTLDLTLTGEYGISSKIGVGLRVTGGHLISRSGYSGIHTAAFANYYGLTSAQFDPYVGLAVGKTTYVREVQGSDNYAGFRVSLQAGVRYWVTRRLGVYAHGLVGLRRDVLPVAEAGLTMNLAH